MFLKVSTLEELKLPIDLSVSDLSASEVKIDVIVIVLLIFFTLG